MTAFRNMPSLCYTVMCHCINEKIYIYLQKSTNILVSSLKYPLIASIYHVLNVTVNILGIYYNPLTKLAKCLYVYVYMCVYICIYVCTCIYQVLCMCSHPLCTDSLSCKILSTYSKQTPKITYTIMWRTTLIIYQYALFFLLIALYSLLKALS